MDLMLVLLVVAAFPAGCLLFVLWMGRLEDSIPAGVRRATRRPDPPPILTVPVRRTAAASPGWWDRVVDTNPALDAAEAHARQGGTPHSAPEIPALDPIPAQRTPPAATPAAAAGSPTAATPAASPTGPLAQPEPLAGT